MDWIVDALINKAGNCEAVVVIRERDGKILSGVFRNKVDALTCIDQRVIPRTTFRADEAAAWDALHARFTLRRINHQEAHSLRDEAQTHTNNVEGFFSRMRRD
jgi:hypothetical protein